MKTVQFKDIPSKVKDLMIRITCDDYKQNDDIYLDWLHKWDKWSLATDEERLAYAEWMYKIGVRLKDAYDYEEYGLKSRDTIFYLEKDPRSPHDILLTRHEHHTDITIYDSDKNKWAEIIEEPFNLTDTGDFRSEPEFKAGDEVSPNFYENLPDDMWITCDPYFFVGKTRDGRFCVETRSGNIHVVYGVRKSDPDSKLREIAKDLIDKWVVVTEKRDELQTAIFTTDGVEQMLIEALKKGKEL